MTDGFFFTISFTIFVLPSSSSSSAIAKIIFYSFLVSRFSPVRKNLVGGKILPGVVYAIPGGLPYRAFPKCAVVSVRGVHLR
jgi:hypothetical protein